MSKFLECVQGVIDWGKENVPEFNENSISDGYHTFDELYEFRKAYNACLFNEWAKHDGFDYQSNDPTEHKMYSVHKSWRHHDGEECFPDSKHKWFIVCAMLPTGLISNHYKESDWNLFQIPEVEKALFPFDGHTGEDVLNRLKSLATPMNQ